MQPVNVTHAHACSSAPSSAAAESTLVAKQVKRRQWLTTLLELRRVYGALIHAYTCLQLPSPVYQPPATMPQSGDGAAQAGGDASASVEDEKERELVEKELRERALETVADMALTSDQLKASLRTLPQRFRTVFGPEWGEGSEQAIRDTAQDLSSKLKERVAAELPLLPFGGASQAQALIDARNSRYTRRLGSTDAPSSPLESYGSGTAIGRFEAAEKVAEQFVQRRIKPALKRAQEAELGDLLRGSGTYLKGLWDRLNGGGKSGKRVGGIEALGLPVPPASRKESEVAIIQLTKQLEELEQQLQGASKARENKLRKAGLPGRVQMAIQLKDLDADVLALSRVLAVRTLQLEMEYVFRSLEDEALDMTGYDMVGFEYGGSTPDWNTSELDLLVADYVMLEEELTALALALTDGGVVGSTAAAAAGIHATAATAPSAAAKALPLGIMGEDVLEKLAVEIPDMRTRVGVMDQVVFGGSGFSVTRLQLQVTESLDKVREAIDFLVRGVRLLGSDVANSGRIFMRAALGGTLKPREVSALRRTARDLLAFIPFTIILIVPITPLGHVLVFGFIQTYFPSFFPSCFTKKRQEIMIK